MMGMAGPSRSSMRAHCQRRRRGGRAAPTVAAAPTTPVLRSTPIYIIYHTIIVLYSQYARWSDDDHSSYWLVAAR